MAAATFNRLVKELGLDGWTAESAGTSASEGDCANEHAVCIFPELRAHRSRQITRGMLGQAELILCMTEKHAAALTRFDAGKRVSLMTQYAGGDGQIDDPYGKGLEEYTVCAGQLRELIGGIIQKIKKDESGL